MGVVNRWDELCFSGTTANENGFFWRAIHVCGRPPSRSSRACANVERRMYLVASVERYPAARRADKGSHRKVRRRSSAPDDDGGSRLSALWISFGVAAWSRFSPIDRPSDRNDNCGPRPATRPCQDPDRAMIEPPGIPRLFPRLEL
jgi:hypothetical protein